MGGCHDLLKAMQSFFFLYLDAIHLSHLSEGMFHVIGCGGVDLGSSGCGPNVPFYSQAQLLLTSVLVLGQACQWCYFTPASTYKLVCLM